MFVSHPWINPNTIEDRDYQKNIVKTAVSGNTLCVIPTGLGKTSIAALVAADCLQKDMNKKILFLAPTKPLVNQHKKTFEKFMKIGEDELKAITGEDKPELRANIYKKADIVFATPQTIRNDLKANILSLKDFSLVIFDEAHRAIGEYAYPYIAKVYKYHCKNPLILALTASPGGHLYKINEVRDKLFIKNVEIRGRDDPDVKPYVQKVENDFVSVELPIPLKSIHQYMEKARNQRMTKLASWKVIHSNILPKTQILRLQQELARRKSGMAFAAMSQLAELIKIDHAQMLLETQCLHSLKAYFLKMEEDAAAGKTKAVARLMNDENMKNAIRLTDELISQGKEHPKMSKLREIVESELKANKMTQFIIFAQFRDTIAKIMEELKNINHSSPIEFIGQAKKKGKGLSQKEQTQILNEFRMGFYNILIASQVGEEGLDVAETDVVIFYEPVPSAVRRVQRAGRTARTQKGKVIMLITKGTRDEAYHWSGHHKERKMNKILYDMQRQGSLKGFGE
ncbi:MAG TPA: DEAD/DEAH box helicase [archaeon]|nr:DEAD/DEAH box helicase [archaeon]